MASLKAERQKEDREFIHLKIRKKDLEKFCAAADLFQGDFLKILDRSSADHRAKRVTKRQNLGELLTA